MGGTSNAGGNEASGGTVSLGRTAPTTGGANPVGGTSAVGGAGGTSSTGGTKSGGGSPATGGTISTGGAPSVGGSSTTGGAVTTGGTLATGGTISMGGTAVTGGTSTTGGTASTGDTIAIGGTTATGGTIATGGALPTGGAPPTGGTSTTGGIASGNGMSSNGGAMSTGGANAAGASGDSGAGSSGGSAGAFACPNTETETMVVVPQGYSIDSTEVTRAQYQAWLDASPTTQGQITDCSWNADLAPDTTCMSSADVCDGNGCCNHPIVCVDWCDAYAYCKAAGKRLCGNIGGGSNGFNDVADASKSQWYNACSSGGQNAFTWGTQYDMSACNTRDRGQGTTTEVASLVGCQSTLTGYVGIYDLTGNVWEWEDSCNGVAGASAACHPRGGSYSSVDSDYYVICSHANNNYRRDSTSSLIGFRCCSL